jgi:hypothetical protein
VERLRKINKDKKGDASSLIIGLVVMVFIVGIIALMAGKVIPQLTNIMKTTSTFASSNNTVNALNIIETKTIPWLDYFFLFAFFGTILGLIISSIYIDTHPAFMIFFVILLVIAIIFAGIFANAYIEIGESSALSATYNQFTATKAIFNNLPLILFVVGLIVIIILYGKSRSSASGGPI